jgi:hypothetical protein
MSRNGKIARLPHNIREDLNLRLENNEEGQPLLDWLNALPQTREVLDKSFNGVPISKQNLSEWRQGGYREWVIRNDLSSHVNLLAENTHWIEMEVDAPVLAGKLATVLAAQYAKVLVDWDGEPDEKIEAKLRVLRIFCRDIALLQRTMHRATNQKNEFYQKADDDEKKEIQEMKDKAKAPLVALLQETALASEAPNNEGLRRIAAFIAAIDNDQPIPKFDDAPLKSQTKSHRVKPRQTNKPPETTLSGGANSCEPTDPPPPMEMNQESKMPPQEPTRTTGPAEESLNDQ